MSENLSTLASAKKAKRDKKDKSAKLQETGGEEEPDGPPTPPVSPVVVVTQQNTLDSHAAYCDMKSDNYMGACKTLSATQLALVEQRQRAMLNAYGIHREETEPISTRLGIVNGDSPVAIRGRGNVRHPFSSFNTDTMWKENALFLFLLCQEYPGFEYENEYLDNGMTIDGAVNDWIDRNPSLYFEALARLLTPPSYAGVSIGITDLMTSFWRKLNITLSHNFWFDVSESTIDMIRVSDQRGDTFTLDKFDTFINSLEREWFVKNQAGTAYLGQTNLPLQMVERYLRITNNVGARPVTIRGFITALNKVHWEALEGLRVATELGFLLTLPSADKGGGGGRPNQRGGGKVKDHHPPSKGKEAHKRKREDNSGSSTTSSICQRCGNDPTKQKGDRCNQSKCIFWDHKDCNRSKDSWKDSETGKAMATLSFVLDNGRTLHPRWLHGDYHLKRGPNRKYTSPSELVKQVHLTLLTFTQSIPNERKHFSPSLCSDSDSHELEEDLREPNELEKVASPHVGGYLSSSKSGSPLVDCYLDDTLLGVALLDTGSLGPVDTIANYISSTLFNKIKSINKQKKKASTYDCICHSAETRTATGSFTTSECITLYVTLASNDIVTNKVKISFRIAHALQNDMIIGFFTFKELDLSKIFRHLFITSHTKEKYILESPRLQCQENDVDILASDSDTTTLDIPNILHESEDLEKSKDSDISTLSRSRRPLATGASSRTRSKSVLHQRQSVQSHTSHTSIAKRKAPTIANNLSNTMYSCHMCVPRVEEDISLQHGILYESAIYINKEDLLDYEEDDDLFDDLVAENPIEAIINDSNKDWDSETDQFRINYILKTITNKELRVLIKPLIERFIGIFRKELPQEPSLLEPFKLQLETGNTWRLNRVNKRAARTQTIVKQYEIRKFLKKGVMNNIIQTSQAEAWSQVHLTPKPNGSWRFCIDFRSLNDATRRLGWPIPNIKEMIQRIGQKRAKYYAVIDLTQGYYQIAMHPDSVPLTAFRVAEGLYEWKRLGMGLKGAASYFQSQLQNTVLSELIYKILELYLDDAITWGDTFQELIDHLEKIFTQFEIFNLFINPDKLKLGFTEIEYTGHVIDRHGASFSEKATNKVLHFRKPKTVKDMKSFLGLINQFRDHIDHYGDLTASLYRLTDEYSKRKSNVIPWDDVLSRDFEIVQARVSNCPKIFFLDDTSPIFLNTDASDVGIGAYLYQLIDGRRFPIQFISKTLTKVEKKWDVVEREAFAIFFALHKLEYLIRDRFFILRTDSKNLTYVNTEHAPKVIRWKLWIQSFDFKVEHTPGKDNIEADGFSRWPELNEEADELHVNTMTIKQSRNKNKLSRQNYEIIKRVHGGVQGHNGVQRTLELIRRSKTPTWKTMRRDVTTFIRECPICQKMSPMNIGSQINPFTLATTEPMQRIYIDTIGPLNILHKDEILRNNANNYILVIIDAFSRYLILYPIKSVTAESALDPLLNWISIFGCPSELVTDNGTQFMNELISQVSEVAMIDKSSIHPYSSEENGIVERANKEAVRHITSMTNEYKEKAEWERYAPFTQRICNTMVHTSIGVSPSQIIFGNSVNHDSQFLYNAKRNTAEQPYKEIITEMLIVQERLLKIARMTQKRTDSLHIARRQISSETIFPVNSYVLVKYENDNKTKLHTTMHGPYRVVSKQGAVYTVQHLITNELFDFHASLIREFLYDEEFTNPETVAMIDTEARGITSVQSHKWFKPKRIANNLMFEIVWDDKDVPEWTHWNSTIGKSEKIHEYLRKNTMVRFIPTQFKWPKDHPDYEKPISRQKR
jgi:hypothetical protein